MFNWVWGDYHLDVELADMKKLTKELEEIIGSSYDAIVVSQANGKIIRASQSIERITGGVPIQEIVGHTPQELELKGYIINQTINRLSKNFITIVQKLKTGVELFITSVPVFDDEGKFLFYVANLRDMTELNKIRRQMEEERNLKDRYYSELIELREKLMQLDNMVFKSSAMQSIIEKVSKVAHTNTNVLITGESGVGKDVIAKLLHKMSPRKDGPFIQINSGAIPETLLESELFGYDKGAFTGANKEGKPGTLEMANGGTVLLDEIGDIPLHLQVKLLRAIQHGEIYRIGRPTVIKLDVRIIAATNKNLEKMVRQGTFREDLYYRLNVIPIHIQALRQRKEDILPLAYHFLKKYNEKHDRYNTFSVPVCHALERYEWPGNVRELENVIERLVVMCSQKEISLELLPEHMQQIDSENFLGDEIIPLKEARKRIEKQMIEKAIQHTGSIRKAAKILEVDHSTLVRKLKQLKKPTAK